jgi:hypothetical protein
VLDRDVVMSFSACFLIVFFLVVVEMLGLPVSNLPLKLCVGSKTGRLERSSTHWATIIMRVQPLQNRCSFKRDTLDGHNRVLHEFLGDGAKEIGRWVHVDAVFF